MMPTQKTPIVDKNGKPTHVHKNVDTASPTRDVPPVKPATDWMKNTGLDLQFLDRAELFDGYPTDELTVSEIENWESRLAERGFVHAIDDEGSIYIIHPETERYVNGNATPDGVNLRLWDSFGGEFNRSLFDSDEAYMDAVEDRFDDLWTDFDGQ